MKREEFNKLFQRYVRHCIFLAEQAIEDAPNRREYLFEQYIFHLTESVKMCRDPYRGHLITLLKQGFRQNLPLSYILEEMETYRLEFLEMLKTEPGMTTELFFDSIVFEDGYREKIRAALNFFVAVGLSRFFKQQIRQKYPLALVGDDSPDEPIIFNIIDNIGKPYAEIIEIPEQKERRINYPEEMNAEEAAEYLNLKSVESLYQLTSAKKIPHYKRGGRKLMFKKSELQSWQLQKISSDDEIKSEVANRMISKPKKK